METFNTKSATRPMIPTRIFLVAALAAVVLQSHGATRPQSSPQTAQLHAATSAEQVPLPRAIAGATEQFHLLVGRSLVITTPTRIKRVSIADPAVADVLLVSPTQLVLNGKVPGGVSLILWDEADQSQTFEIVVDMDIQALTRKIHDVFPQEKIQIEAAREVVVLAGQVSSKAVADRILQVVSAVTPKVVSLMDIPTAPVKGEILLRVRFAEVDRAALDQFGFNLLSVPGPTTRTLATIGTQQFGAVQLSQNNGSTSGSSGGLSSNNLSLSDVLNLFIFRPDVDLGATIRALQQKNLLQILAEPNVLTETGKEANFLAGGEFPFPVVQGGAVGSAPTVTIQFREFGVKLNFKPDLTEDGRIHLRVRPEVSALDFANGLTISGFLVPAISTRRVESEMELDDGQSFAIAGLVDDRIQQVYSRIPILGDIPILGQLFRSRSLNKSKTELLVIVTPEIVKRPTSEPLPAGPKFPKPFLPPAAPEVGKPAPPKK